MFPSMNRLKQQSESTLEYIDKSIRLFKSGLTAMHVNEGTTLAGIIVNIILFMQKIFFLNMV